MRNRVGSPIMLAAALALASVAAGPAYHVRPTNTPWRPGRRKIDQQDPTDAAEQIAAARAKRARRAEKAARPAANQEKP